MNAREKAFDLLCEIILKKKYSNLALRHGMNDYSGLDRSLIVSIVYGTMQNYLYVRYLWEHFISKKLPDDMAVLMDMSIYQLVFLDKLPDYAVVSEAVDIASKKYNGRYKRLINALLRRFLREERRSVDGSSLEKLSIMTSHPLWLVKMWEHQYGFEIARKICENDQKVPLQACRVNTLITDRKTLMKDNGHFTSGRLSPDGLIYDGEALAQTKEYEEGKITIQDEASQCVAYYLNPKPHERILDVCAAPGTKSTHIAQLMHDEGEIIACDIHKHRVELIENSLKRLHISCVHPMVSDGTKAQEVFEHESFDRILLDAPCSGYGVLKRKNDIKVHMQSSDMDEIIPLQQTLLESVSPLLKKGGRLVYSTCTLNKKENEKQIESFLKKHDDFSCEKMQTIFPYEYESDGFFMAALVKK